MSKRGFRLGYFCAGVSFLLYAGLVDRYPVVAIAAVMAIYVLCWRSTEQSIFNRLVWGLPERIHGIILRVTGYRLVGVITGTSEPVSYFWTKDYSPKEERCIYK